jgi:hypothetical protein
MAQLKNQQGIDPQGITAVRHRKMLLLPADQKLNYEEIWAIRL